MVEPELEAEYPFIDISIDTSSAEGDEEVAQILGNVHVGQLIAHTLQTINVRQPVMLTLMVTDDTEIQRLNRQYRQQDRPTDVLSFPLLEKPLVEAPLDWLWQIPDCVEDEEGNAVQAEATIPAFVTPDEMATNLGDIAISWPTVQRQASAAGHSATHELLFLLCHGVLHLVGYDDQTEAGYTEMVRLQTAILDHLRPES